MLNIVGTNVTAYAVHPGIAKTELGRHFGMNKSLISGTLLAPLWWSVMKSPEQACQNVLYCALDPELADESGGFYR